MKDTDKVQVWVSKTEVKAGHDWGAISTKTVETLDFDKMVCSWHYTGTHEGDRVDSRGEVEISPEATPEKAAARRRRQGYSRIA